MRVIDPGHIYHVHDSDSPDGTTQDIVFVRRRDDNGELLPPERREPGILTQELLRVAIDRTLYLNAEAPCDEDVKIINHLRSALSLYESRAARRTIEKLSKPEAADVCSKCHHILCLHERA